MSTYQSMFGSAIKKWKEKRERRKRQKNSETTPPPMDVDDSSTEPRQPLGGIPQASPIVSQEWDLASASRQHSIVITGASEDILAQSPTPLTTIEPYQSLGVTHQATPVENQESNMASASSEPSISNRTCEASPSVPTEPTITGMGEETRSEPYRAPGSSAHPNIQTPRAMGQRAIDTELSDIGHSTQKRTISPLWRNAVEKLRREKLDSFEETRETEVQLAQALIGEVEKIHKKVDEEKLHYRNSTGEKVYYGEVLLTQLQKIVVIGDIAIQHHPDVVALVWSGFRLLLQVGAAHYQNMAMISSALGYLSWVIRCGEIYERLYLESQQGSAGLSECLVDQYVSMLKYLLCAKQHLQKSAAARITESLSTKLARLLEDVRESEKRTRESADLAEKEAAFISRSNERTSISKLRGHLSDLRKEMKAIETAVDDCNTNLKRLCEYVEETKRKNALDWISKTEYGLIHDEHSTRRTPGTCNWLQENSQFDDWLNRRSSPVFWLRGAAGTGKTILCSKVIDLLKELYAGKHALAYFYCSTTTPDRSQPASVLRAIVRQLCLAYSKEGLPASLLKIYERRTLESAGLMQLEESKNLIIEISKHLPGVWIFIDALDECDLEERKNLLVILKNILGTVETVRMFLTSRFEPDIILHMESYSGHEIRQHDNSNDIRLYVESELRRLYDLNAGAAVRRLKDREGSILALSEDADGMFLPICLRMQALGRETGAGGMDHALNHTPNGLNNMYMDIIKRIEKNPTESRLAFNTIHWLFNTIDDCSPSIVLQALQIDTKINPELKSVEIETNEIPGICHGLVVHDDKTGIFRFSHATVREFLEQGATSCGPMDQRSVGQYFLMRRHEGEAWVANVCWEALLSTDYGDEEVYKSESPQYSLLKYSARNWGHHLRPLLLRSPDVARRLQDFLNGSSKEFQGWASQVGNLLPGLRAKEDLIISPLWVACYYRLFDTFITLLQTFSPDCVNLAGRTPLHHSAENGYLEFVQHLLCLKSLNANCTDDMRYTPLILAIESDQIDVVEALVTRHDLDVNVADECGRTALMHASSGGRHTILKHLIATKLCDPNIKDNEGLTALHQAIANGHELVVESLLKLVPNIELNCTDSSGKTPLWIAAIAGHQDMVRRLLDDRRVDINVRCLNSETLLIWAAKQNQGWLVRSLLERDDLRINEEGLYGWSALACAAWYGSLDALQWILKAHGVDIEHPDQDGDTPLMLATTRGNIEVIHTLLEIKPNGPQEHDATTLAQSRLLNGANINASRNEGLTALHLSAHDGHIEALQALLSHGADISAVTSQGFTALHLSAHDGHTEALQVLLSHGADISAVTNQGFTALHLSAQDGHTEALQALLSHGADISAATNQGSTALHLSAQNGHTEALQVLLSHGADISAATNQGSTALHLSAQDDHTEALQVLLSHGADISAVTNQGFTALHLSAKNGHTETLEALLSHGADISAATNQGLTALHLSAKNGHTETLQALLSHGADISAATNQGSTALHLSAKNGHTETLQALLSHGADISAATNQGSTALHLSAKNGHTETLRALLSHGADNSAITNDGWTALHLAAQNGHTGTLQVLLSRGADISAAQNDGLTALHLAAQNGHTETLQVLLSYGANATLADKTGWTALHSATSEGSVLSVTMLLEIPSVDWRLPSHHGTTPLLSAAEDGYVEIFEMLLARYDEADKLQEVDNDGDTPLLCAAISGKRRIVELVLGRGGHDINHQDKLGLTALICAARGGHAGVVELLLKEDGIDVSIVEKGGKSAFDVAKDGGYEEVMALLAPSVDQTVM